MTRIIKIVSLVGSSRFKEEFQEVGERLEKSGILALAMTFFRHADGVPVSEEERLILERVDRARIDLANAVFVINPGGYIGPSTQAEIAYAKSLGKPIQFMEPSEGF